MPSPRRHPAALFAGLLTALASPAATQPVVYDAALEVEVVVTGLTGPTTMAFVDFEDFLVLEKETGNVRFVDDWVLQGAPLLTLPVETASERGALGIVYDPFTQKVFIYYTRDADDNGTPEANRIVRFDWTGSALNNEVLIRDLPALNGPNHDGGVLALDNGGNLLAMIGDLNRAGHLQNQASGAADDTSVILRLDQDGAPALSNPLSPYCSNEPAPNICVSDADCGGTVGACQTEVASYYAYGVRNGFGLAVDPFTGEVWDTENGPGNDDEVNLVLPGFNSGWSRSMGPRVLGEGPLFPIDGSAYSDPEFTWVDTNAPTGILLPCGCALGPLYDQSAIVGDSNRGQLYRFPLNDTRDAFDLSATPALVDLVAANNTEADLVRLASGFAGVTDVELGPDGNIYVVSIGDPTQAQGAIYRLHKPPREFFTVAPCRVFDSRSGAALAHNVDRTINVAGSCGVPADAKAVAINVTVTQATASGHVTLFPGNFPLPNVSTLNFSAGQTRANNAVLPLATDGDGDVRARPTTSGGSIHLIVDVVGYFATVPASFGIGGTGAVAASGRIGAAGSLPACPKRSPGSGASSR